MGSLAWNTGEVCMELVAMGAWLEYCLWYKGVGWIVWRRVRMNQDRWSKCPGKGDKGGGKPKAGAALYHKFTIPGPEENEPMGVLGSKLQ